MPKDKEAPVVQSVNRPVSEEYRIYSLERLPDEDGLLFCAGCSCNTTNAFRIGSVVRCLSCLTAILVDLGAFIAVPAKAAAQRGL